MNILIVDDSVVFRGAIRAALDGVNKLNIVGVANNGRAAIEFLKNNVVDLITLDMEMPEMDGLQTIREIRALKLKVRILVFSGHTTAGSQMALEALNLGADDFVCKPQGDSGQSGNVIELIHNELIPKISQFDAGIQSFKDKDNVTSSIDLKKLETKSQIIPRDINTFLPNIILIGSSTGGPPALETVLSGINQPLRIPILITQHMPPVFTDSLAKRLAKLTGIDCAEAKHGEIIKSNKIYVAPGNYHLKLEQVGKNVLVSLDQSAQRNSVRPAVDVMFESAAKIYTSRALGIVLTGMGEDGLAGCYEIKKNAGGVMIQDKESCVVFGMPGAVYNKGIYDKIADLVEINNQIKRMTN